MPAGAPRRGAGTCPNAAGGPRRGAGTCPHACGRVAVGDDPRGRLRRKTSGRTLDWPRLERGTGTRHGSSRSKGVLPEDTLAVGVRLEVMGEMRPIKSMLIRAFDAKDFLRF